MAATKDGEKDPRSENDPVRGRRGGRTTVTRSRVRKTFWIDRDVEERLREEASRARRDESELVREVLRSHYGLE